MTPFCSPPCTKAIKRSEKKTSTFYRYCVPREPLWTATRAGISSPVAEDDRRRRVSRLPDRSDRRTDEMSRRRDGNVRDLIYYYSKWATRRAGSVTNDRERAATAEPSLWADIKAPKSPRGEREDASKRINRIKAARIIRSWLKKFSLSFVLWSLQRCGGKDSNVFLPLYTKY